METQGLVDVSHDMTRYDAIRLKQLIEQAPALHQLGCGATHPRRMAGDAGAIRQGRSCRWITGASSARCRPAEADRRACRCRTSRNCAAPPPRWRSWTMGKPTGFMEYERVETGYEPAGDRVVHYKSSSVRSAPRRSESKARAAWIAVFHTVIRAVRSTTSSRTGTTSSTAATGSPRSRCCTRRTISRSSLGVSAPPPVRRPAR